MKTKQNAQKQKNNNNNNEKVYILDTEKQISYPVLTGSSPECRLVWMVPFSTPKSRGGLAGSAVGASLWDEALRMLVRR